MKKYVAVLLGCVLLVTGCGGAPSGSTQAVNDNTNASVDVAPVPTAEIADGGEILAPSMYATLLAMPEASGFVEAVNMFPELRAALSDPADTLTVFVPSNEALGQMKGQNSAKLLRTLKYHISTQSASESDLIILNDPMPFETLAKKSLTVQAVEGGYMLGGKKANLVAPTVFTANGTALLIDTVLEID